MSNEPADKPALPEHVRLFVAIRLPHSVKTEIGRVRTELRQVLKADSICWTPEDQLHLTLKFLGNISSNQTEPLSAALQLACDPFNPLRLCARQLGFFPEQGFPRVLWIGVEDELKSLGGLQAAIEEVVKPFSHEPRGKAFSAHVTIGRVRHLVRADEEYLREYAHGHPGQSFGSWTADTIELMQSTLSSAGPHHRPLAMFPLRAL